MTLQDPPHHFASLKSWEHLGQWKQEGKFSPQSISLATYRHHPGWILWSPDFLARRDPEAHLGHQFYTKSPDTCAPKAIIKPTFWRRRSNDYLLQWTMGLRPLFKLWWTAAVLHHFLWCSPYWFWCSWKSLARIPKSKSAIFQQQDVMAGLIV